MNTAGASRAMKPAGQRRDMNPTGELIAALLTPPGRGAIASIRVQGPGATALVLAHFTRDLPPPGSASAAYRAAECDPLPLGRILYGRWGGPPGEQIVVCRRDDDAVELHCHGGLAASEAILLVLESGGAKRVDWPTWLSRAHDAITAEALTALAAARTVRTASLLLDQLGGALARELARIDEDLSAGRSEAARRAIDALLARAALGRRLTAPFRVVLCGRPNVGKSSLLNTLVGYERAIVHAAPGTTRDLVQAATAVDGWPVEFSDTAGLRATDDPIESQGVALARESAAAADLALFVTDGTAPFSEEERAWERDLQRALVVANKSDLPRCEDAARPAGPAVSALTGFGLEQLLAEIARRLVPDPPAPGTAIPFTERQVEELRERRRRAEPEGASGGARG